MSDVPGGRDKAQAEAELFERLQNSNGALKIYGEDSAP
jgi:hypothetical protein